MRKIFPEYGTGGVGEDVGGNITLGLSRSVYVERSSTVEGVINARWKSTEKFLEKRKGVIICFLK